MSNFQTYQLPTIEGNFNLLQDYAYGIFNTIIYHRALGHNNPVEHKCQLLDQFYMKCGDSQLERHITSRIDSMLENITKNRDDEISLMFYNQTQSSSGGLFSAPVTKKEPWEIWIVPFKFIDISDGQINLEQQSEKFSKLIMDVIDKVNENTDCMPNIYDGLKCYPYQIDVKKAGGSSAKSGTSSFLGLGGLLKKLTN